MLKGRESNKMNQSTVFETLGNVELLSQQKIAIFASKSAPEEIYDRSSELFDNLLKLPLTLASGWQAPLEKILFGKIKSENQANFIHYLGRDINQFVPTEKQQFLLDQEKLLIIAPILKDKRASDPAIKKRDSLIFSQVKKVLFLYIETNGRLETYFRQLSQQSYQIYLFDHPINKAFFHDDIVLVNEDNVSTILIS